MPTEKKVQHPGTPFLQEKVVVITGGSSGIGKAIAREIGEMGPLLCLLGREIERLEIVAKAISEKCPRIFCYPCDLAVDEDIRKVSEQISGAHGGVDILIHSAGAFSFGTLETTDIADFDHLYRVNVRAPYLLTQAFLPTIILRKGQIVFINSSAGLNANANIAPYAATKHALKAIADSLRQEVNAQDVRVLSIYPGRTATPMQAEVHRMEGKNYRPGHLLQPEDVAKSVLHALSLPRTAELTDLSIRPMLNSR